MTTIDPDALYFADNGIVLCGDHLGVSARTTYHDISGQRIAQMNDDDARELWAMHCEPKCEQCGKEWSK